MYGKYPKVMENGKLVEQNGLNGAPKAWPVSDKFEPVKTVQAAKDEVDINKIMQRIEKGQMMDMLKDDGRFEDISEFEGLENAIIKVGKANEYFMDLPAEVRERFNNDPVDLIEFLQDEENRAEAEKLGLVNPKEAGEPASIPPATGGTTQ